MVDPGKKPEEIRFGSGCKVVIDVNDPLYFHSNDTNGTPLIRIKLTGTENYRIWAAALKHCIHSKNKLGFINDGSVIFDIHYKINIVTQNGSKLSDYYHKLNSLWREYDAMVALPAYTCDGASFYKDHAQLLKLMQFVMGLDDVYAPIRSTLLTTNPLSTVKEAFSLLSRDNASRFAAKFVDDKKERCFELIGYPPNLKKRNNSGQKVSVSGKIADLSAGVSHTHTNDQYKRLMSLLGDYGPSSSASQSNMVGFCSQIPSGASSEKDGLYFLNLVKNVFSLDMVLIKKGYKLYSLDSKQFLFARDVKFYETVYPFKNDSLTKEYLKEIEGINNFFYIQRSNVPYDDVRDNSKGGGTNPSSIDSAVEIADAELSPTPTAEPSASTSNIEAASYPRWIEAINAKTGALTRNMTWVVTKLPSGRRPIGSKWIYKVKYKSTSEVERKYCLELLNEFGMLAAKPSKVPLYVGKSNKPVKIVDGERIPRKEKDKIGSKPDKNGKRGEAEKSQKQLQSVMHSPKQSDLMLASKVLRYLKGSPGKGILYEKSNEFNVSAYVNSDWAKCTAAMRSSAEAEFRAMSNVTCEVIWVLKIITKLKVNYDTPVNMFCDSSAAIQIAASPVFHERTKHFEIDMFFLREKITDGVIKTCKIRRECG
nr:hypothetical protein [Tanacetum cinerariifolium]